MRAKSLAALLLLTVLVHTVGTIPALADWDVNQPSVFSQLPDPTGWDVYSEWRYGVADDWTATETIGVADIHFWGSWKNDVWGDMGNLLIQIYDNDTSGSFPKPGNQLWEYVVPKEGPYAYSTKKFDNIGWQGWYDPRGVDDWDDNNHQDMYQYNVIINPGNPEGIFLQEEGQTYWLEISSNYTGCDWGWKTSVDNDNGGTAVFWDRYGHHGWYWQKLYEPQGWCDLHGKTPEPLGMAVAITPEPTTLLLFAMGAVAVLRRRSR